MSSATPAKQEQPAQTISSNTNTPVQAQQSQTGTTGSRGVYGKIDAFLQQLLDIASKADAEEAKRLEESRKRDEMEEGEIDAEEVVIAEAEERRKKEEAEEERERHTKEEKARKAKDKAREVSERLANEAIASASKEKKQEVCAGCRVMGGLGLWSSEFIY